MLLTAIAKFVYRFLGLVFVFLDVFQSFCKKREEQKKEREK